MAKLGDGFLRQVAGAMHSPFVIQAATSRGIASSFERSP